MDATIISIARDKYTKNSLTCVCSKWENLGFRTKGCHHYFCRFLMNPDVEGMTPEEAFDKYGPPRFPTPPEPPTNGPSHAARILRAA